MNIPPTRKLMDNIRWLVILNSSYSLLTRHPHNFEMVYSWPPYLLVSKAIQSVYLVPKDLEILLFLCSLAFFRNTYFGCLIGDYFSLCFWFYLNALGVKWSPPGTRVEIYTKPVENVTQPHFCNGPHLLSLSLCFLESQYNNIKLMYLLYFLCLLLSLHA